MKVNTLTTLILTLALLLSNLGSVAQAGADSANYLVVQTDPPSGPPAGAENGRSASVELPPGVSDDWWAAVQEDIRQSEYHITWQERTYLADLEAAYQAPNRAQNLRAYFTPQGVRLIPRVFEGETTPWEWGLSLIGYGYPDAVQPASAAALRLAGNRIEYRREDLTEWYLNDERGLEQGFTLRAPPTAAPNDRTGAEIVLELAPPYQHGVSGGLTPHLTAAGDVEFTTPGGVTVLRYGELHVYDAAGRGLPSTLKVIEPSPVPHITPHTSRLVPYVLRITFDATNAAFPITVDPLATSPAWTAEGNQPWAWFGYAVGTAGDVNDDGYSDVIVGAKGYDNGQEDEGRAYVYHGSAVGLSAAADWWAESNQEDAAFGYAVGTAGDVNDDGYSDVIVGAIGYDSIDEIDVGRAYVYHGSAAGLSVAPDWMAGCNHYRAFLGYAVGTAGDVNGDGYSDVVVSAPGYSLYGRVYVYHGSAAGLSAAEDWWAESDQTVTSFGSSVGTAGDVNDDGYSDVIIGAPYYDNNNTNEGRAFVYHGSAAGLSAAADWTAEGYRTNGYFGISVGTAGDVNGDSYSDIIVGEDRFGPGYEMRGWVYVYHGSGAGLSTTYDWRTFCNQEGARFGVSVGTAGDVNGDGYSDVIVGASKYNNGEVYEGRAYVYHGSVAGLSAPAAWITESNQAGARFGISVGTAGDVNGDDYSDVIVGAYGYTNGESSEGRAYVYHGSAPDLIYLPLVIRP